MDLHAARAQFPLLRTTVVRDGRQLPLVYLDSAATALKPQSVIDAITDYYTNYGVSTHRGIYELSQQATDRFEAVREHVGRYFNLDERYAVVFTHGTTESLNVVAHAWARHNLTPQDEIVLTEMEHHSNIVPWQQVRDATGCTLRPIPVDATRHVVDTEDIDGWFGKRTRVLALTGMSNVTGWQPPLRQIVAAAHRRGVVVVVDGAQLAAHKRINLPAMGCDFFACSAHKMCGPTGVGILIGKRALFAKAKAFITGGNMITRVRMDESVFKDAPERFEAGTPHIAGVIGFGAALNMVEEWDFAEIARHEQRLVEQAYNALSSIPEVMLYAGPPTQRGAGEGAAAGRGVAEAGSAGEGAAAEHAAVVAFNVRGAHAHDVGSILDQEGVAVRAGHHCAQPYHAALHIESSVRASFHLYNTPADVEALIRGVKRAVKIFS